MLGFAPEEYIGKSIVDFHADKAKIDDILKILLSGKRSKRSSLIPTSISRFPSLQNGTLYFWRMPKSLTYFKLTSRNKHLRIINYVAPLKAKDGKRNELVEINIFFQTSYAL